MRKYKILFLNHTSKLGGAERSLIDFINFIKEKEINDIDPYLIVNENGDLANILSKKIVVDVIPDTLKLKRENNIIYNFTKVANIKFAKFLLSFRKKIQEIKPDLIYINSLRSLFYWSLISRFLTFKPKTVYYVRDILSKEFINSLNLFVLKKFLLREIDCYICNSFYTAKALEALIGKKDKIEVIYNPAPHISVLNTGKAKEFLKKRICNFENKILIASFSRISPWKNQEVILESLLYIPKEVLNKVCILFFGDALFGEEKYKKMLMEKMEKLSRKLPIYYIGNVTDVLSFMALCDVILHTSKKPEPFGRVIVEGMSLGKIVISSGIGGAGELIKDGFNGFVFSPNSPKDLGRKITQVFKLIQEGRDKEIRKNAVITARNLDREIIFSKKLTLLKTLLKTKEEVEK